MNWLNNSHKSADIEKDVKRHIKAFFEKNKTNICDSNHNIFSAIVYNSTIIEELSQLLVEKVFCTLFDQLFVNQNKKDSIDSTSINKHLQTLSEYMSNGFIYTDTKGNIHYTLPHLLTKEFEISNILKTIQNELSRLAQVQETTVRESNSIIQKQHDSLLRYDNDLLYKSKNHLLNEVIGIADQIKQIVDDQTIEEDYSKLLEDIQALGDWVDATLQTESVRKYEYAKLSHDRFDSKYQEVVETRYTSNKHEDGTYKTILPGYFWTIPMVSSTIPQSEVNSPKSFEFILRHEKVVRLKYKLDSTISEPKNEASDLVNRSSVLKSDIKNARLEESSPVDDILNSRMTMEENLVKGSDTNSSSQHCDREMETVSKQESFVEGETMPHIIDNESIENSFKDKSAKKTTQRKRYS